MATTSVGTGRAPYQSLEKYFDATFITDDKKLYFGNGGDFSFEYDEDGADVLLTAGANLRMSDTQQLQLGDTSDILMYYNPTSDCLVVLGIPTTNPEIAGAIFASDAGGTILRIAS